MTTPLTAESDAAGRIAWLKRENARLREANAALLAERATLETRAIEAQGRFEASRREADELRRRLVDAESRVRTARCQAEPSEG